MRGADTHQEGLFSHVSPETCIPKNRPLREIRRLTDAALAALSSDSEAATRRWALLDCPGEADSRCCCRCSTRSEASGF
jgi:hypothetical protein